MHFNPQLYRYPSQRTLVYANRGMVSTTSPQAAQAGIDILRRGGNAVDAAVAAAACLTVTEPTSNGIGGDAFALVWSGGKLHGLNASGPSPKAASAEAVRRMGYREMPKYGWIPVTVPGAPSAWSALSQRFGRLSLSTLLAPAIDYAQNGYPVGVTPGRLWDNTWKLYSKVLEDDIFQHWFQHFSIDGRCPRTGDIWHSPHMAQTLGEIGDSNGDSFYRGRLAQQICDFSAATGDWLTAGDLADYRPQWVDPIHVNYRGYDVWEIPPNGHGICVLMALNILSGLELSANREEERNYHLQIEALKLAYADTTRFVADPACMPVRVEDLLSTAYAEERRGLIGETAHLPHPGLPPSSGTVYLCTADGEGNMVSYIQSNYMGFGSGLVVPGTGIALHNRGNNFVLEPGHPNELAAGKRPYHTIIPGFISRGGLPIGPFGVMGAFMQPQGHLQMVCNMADFGLNPQEALDAPRWQWLRDNQVELEHGVPLPIIRQLGARGHIVTVQEDYTAMGRGQIIHRLDNGVLCGGTEPRADGSIAVL